MFSKVVPKPKSSVADPDSGSNALDPWIRDPDPGSGMEENPDPGSGIRDEYPDLIFENLASVFGVENTKTSLMQVPIRDLVNPGSWIRDGKSRIRDKHSGSATMPKLIIKNPPTLELRKKKEVLDPWWT